MSPLIVIGVAVAVVLAGVLFVARSLRRRAAPRMNPISWDRIPDCLDQLLRRGYDAGFVAFTIPDEERFVSVTKYLSDTGVGGLEFDFPRSSWSLEYYEEVQRLLRARGHQVEIVRTPDGPVTEYLKVDCGPDVKTAAALVRLVLEDVFSYAPGSPLVAELQQVAARAEMIDTG